MCTHLSRRFFSNVSNKDRIFSYYAYTIPKALHIKNKNFGKVTPSFGYAGEDAFFSLKLHKHLFVGVADGVGSWKPQKQKEAALYAQKLMLDGIHYLQKNTEHQNNSFSPYKIAEFVYSNNNLFGASTLTLIDITTDKMSAYQLGDSLFCVFRRQNDDSYKCIYKSLAQKKGFGIPYQIGSHSTANSIEDGFFLETLTLKASDIVMIGSDGLWDNCFDDEISEIICDEMKKYFDEWIEKKEKSVLSFENFVHYKVVNGEVTHRIMKQAYMNSIDKKKQSPWSKAMNEEVDMVYNGGKVDDITCAIIYIHNWDNCRL